MINYKITSIQKKNISFQFYRWILPRTNRKERVRGRPYDLT